MFDQTKYRMLDPLAYKNKVSIMSKKPRTTIIPNYIEKIIVDKNLNYIDNENIRAKIFLKELFKMKLSNSTIKKHFESIKPLLFKNTKILANCMVFENKIIQHNKVPNYKNINNLIEYLKTTNSKYKWPLLLALYSGLRLKDIIHFKISYLIMLKKKQETIPLSTKTNGEWKVLYHDIFEKFINHLIKDTFKNDCNFYFQYNIDLFLFQNISKSLLHYKLREMYILANEGEIPPLGFGMYIFRYFFSLMLIKQRSGAFAKMYLGHIKLKSTEIYNSNINLNKVFRLKLKRIYSQNSINSKIHKSLKESELCDTISKETLK